MPDRGAVKNWTEFVWSYADSLGVAELFALFAGGILLHVGVPSLPDGKMSNGRAFLVLSAGMMVAAIATAIVIGYLGWSFLFAPLVGGVAGLVALPLILAVARGGKRVQDRAEDLTDRAIDKVVK